MVYTHFEKDGKLKKIFGLVPSIEYKEDRSQKTEEKIVLSFKF
jgi:hypothetical protein